MKNIERHNSETAREYALRAITENIKSIDLEPGQSISENEISSFLGISRTPVRESIQELSKAALIEIYPQRGSYVSLINSQYVEEAVFLRKILDIAVIEEACDLASNEDIAHLEDNLSKQEYYLQEADTEKIYELDNEFHRMIYGAAKKEIIYDLRRVLMIHFERVRTLSMLTVKDIKIVDDHCIMVDAIKNKDKVKAKEIVETHLNRYIVNQQELFKIYPQYFENVSHRL